MFVSKQNIETVAAKEEDTSAVNDQGRPARNSTYILITHLPNFDLQKAGVKYCLQLEVVYRYFVRSLKR